MTEKRFTIEYVHGNPTIFHILDNREHIDEMKICDLLNEQHEQIQVLKATNGEMEDYLARLEEENEQLKSKNLILKGKLHQLRLKCGKQEEEIECLSEETIEKFKQDLQDGNFIEFTAR